MAALKLNDFSTARTMFLREIKRSPYNHEFHYALGVAYLRLGERNAAREEIALALENATTRASTRTYAAKLEMIKTAQTYPN
jgi:Flp pilus assembly protein TadD